jgi:hypothetical protein
MGESYDASNYFEQPMTQIPIAMKIKEVNKWNPSELREILAR